MSSRYLLKLLKIVASTALIVFIGIMAFFFISEDYNAFIVLSDSMKPAISSGDLVLVGLPNRPFVDEIKPDSIITYRHNENLVTHRIVTVTADTLVTKGDAMEGPDPWLVSRLDDLEGCYITHIPYVGKFSTFIRTKTGWFLTVILPALFLLALIIKEIVKEALKENKPWLKGGRIRY